MKPKPPTPAIDVREILTPILNSAFAFGIAAAKMNPKATEDNHGEWVLEPEIKALNQFYVEEMLKCLPKLRDINIEIPDTLHRNIGFNQAIGEFRTAIKDKFLGGK